MSQPLRAAMADITRAATSIIASGAGGRDDDSVPVALVAGTAVAGTAATVSAIAGPSAGGASRCRRARTGTCWCSRAPAAAC